MASTGCSDGCGLVATPTNACIPVHLLVQSYLPVGASYFASERSFAQLRLPDAHHALVGFGKDPTTVLVVSATGGIYKGSFDPEQGGSCDVQSFVQFEES